MRSWCYTPRSSWICSLMRSYRSFLSSISFILGRKVHSSSPESSELLPLLNASLSRSSFSMLLCKMATRAPCLFSGTVYRGTVDFTVVFLLMVDWEPISFPLFLKVSALRFDMRSFLRMRASSNCYSLIRSKTSISRRRAASASSSFFFSSSRSLIARCCNFTISSCLVRLC